MTHDPTLDPSRRLRRARGPLLALLLAVPALALAACGDDEPSGHAGHDMSGGPRTTTTVPEGTGAVVPRPSADAGAVDRAFVAQMVPHHEMAVAMARMIPGRAERPELRALGRRIVAAQEDEIAQLRRIARRIGAEPLSSGHDDEAMDDHGMEGMDDDHGTDGGHGSGGDLARDAATLGLAADEMGMAMAMAPLGRLDGEAFDRAFVDAMIPHHQGAIRMARAVLAHGRDAGIRRLAQGIVAAQSREIEQMNRWRRAWFGAASPAGGVPRDAG